MIRTDSLPAALAFNKGRLRHKGKRDLRRAYEVMEAHGLRAVALWIPREWNRVADGASKCADVAQLRRWAAETGLQPRLAAPWRQ